TGQECPPGVTGELVVTQPMPSMPVGFWGEPGVADADGPGPAYRRAYFEDIPGRWRHGDWITIFEDGGCVVSGRSDATLNRGGVRPGGARRGCRRRPAGRALTVRHARRGQRARQRARRRAAAVARQ